MKRLLSLSFLALILAFSACQDDSSLISPQNEETTFTAAAEPNWIGLPAAKDKRMQKVHYNANYITKNGGGLIDLADSYISVTGDTVTISSSLYFPPNCVLVDHEITMELDDETGVSTFLPHQMFDQPAILNQRFEGIDLSSLDDTKEIKYYYLKTDGTYEEMVCDQIKINKALGTLEIVNGKIPHFSRYGFAN